MKKLVSIDYVEAQSICEAIRFAVFSAHSLAVKALVASSRPNLLPEMRELYLSHYETYMDKKKKFESLLVDL